MANSKLLTQLKELAYDMVDNNGNFRTVPIGNVGKRNLSDDRLQLLRNIISLIKDTDIITQETRLYIFNETMTIKWVNKKMNELAEEHGREPVPYNTTASKISYDRTKLEKAFGESILADIIFRTNNNDDIKNYGVLVGKAYIKYGKKDDNDIRDNILLKLDRNCLCSEISDEMFGHFLSVILPYTKNQMDQVVEYLDKEEVGYLNYIVGSPVLTDVDKERLNTLKLHLGLIESDGDIVTVLPEAENDTNDKKEETLDIDNCDIEIE